MGRTAPTTLFLIGSLLVAAFFAKSASGASLGLADNLLAERGDLRAFGLVNDHGAAAVYVDSEDYAGVRRAAMDLCDDIERVSGMRPALKVGEKPLGKAVVIAGTLGHSAVIEQLVQTGKVQISSIEGKWESFTISTVENPFPGVAQALVVVGSNKRGAIYGLYEISEQIGVSPWYWWADVPTRHRDTIFLKSGTFVQGPPAVKYRGIFLNDERPCLTTWAADKFGGLNSKFYSKIFELLLRLRANYLWPAMWDNAFSEDDPENPRLADEYGIVMGTSHHEPMMRAHEEWTRRRAAYGNGKWDYATNAEALRLFFREGIARNKRYDNLVTIGMRGDGDEPMTSSGNIASDIELLRQIFSDQRSILAEEMNTDPANVPQVWTLFTEVQSLYEHGLRPPDDVTLLWTDDNTGNLRHLPTHEERNRSGGSGIYYHLDMHGGPFSYQWINTNPLTKIAEQMNLAYQYGATRIWIANVGHLKPLALPTEFFLRLAWNPSEISKDRIAEYSRRWAERDFGAQHAAEIAELSALYAKYNGWRKPEMVKPDSFSQINYNEAERVEAAWQNLVSRSEALYAALPDEQRDAFYELVLHPVKASALVAEINITAGRNLLYAKQGRASTNALAARVRDLFLQDRDMSDYCDRVLAKGKWNHLLNQTHLGQFDWEPPVVDVMPAVSEVLPMDVSRFGVSIDGDVNTWPGHFGDAVLPAFDSFQPRRSYIDIFAIGTKPIEFSIVATQPWIVITADKTDRIDKRYWVDIDWNKVEEGTTSGEILITGGRSVVNVKVPVVKGTHEQRVLATGRFATLTGTMAIAATAAAARTSVAGTSWEVIPDYGRFDGALGIYPVAAESVLPPEKSPHIEYPVYLPRNGSYTVTLEIGPVMDFVRDRGMRVAVSFDDEPSQVLDIFADRQTETFLGRNWLTHVTRDNLRYLSSVHSIKAPGRHTLKIAMVDAGIVLEKIDISDHGFRESYFGPPECDPVR